MSLFVKKIVLRNFCVQAWQYWYAQWNASHIPSVHIIWRKQVAKLWQRDRGVSKGLSHITPKSVQDATSGTVIVHFHQCDTKLLARYFHLCLSLSLSLTLTPSHTCRFTTSQSCRTAMVARVRQNCTCPISRRRSGKWQHRLTDVVSWLAVHYSLYINYISFSW